MAALTASCTDLNIQGNGAYSVLKQLATIALQKRFYHQLTQTCCKPCCCAKKCTLLDLVPVSPCRTVKAPALNNRSYYSPAKRRLLTGKPAMAKATIAGSASAYRKAAKRIRYKSSAHCRKIIHKEFIHQLQQGDTDQVLALLNQTLSS